MLLNEDLELVAQGIQIGQKYTFVGFNSWGMLYHRHVIPTRMEIVKVWDWKGKSVKMDSLHIEVDYPDEQMDKRRKKRLPLENGLPLVYSVDNKMKGGFMVFEGWLPETRITTLPHRMYQTATMFNKNMSVRNFLIHINAFQPKCLEVVRRDLGVDPLVYCMVDRGWLDIQLLEERVKRFERFTQTSPLWMNHTQKEEQPPSQRVIPVYTCKHGCLYQSKHRGAMNLHEHVHCKLKSVKEQLPLKA
ncbi:hypothetical protein A8990_13145 [Paenibacillus taihuensis]|uniref:Uncharacterized protein n=1 Tax=Paenibacillus taihuensis TaxID=1156355 RepID=A0A3D9R3S7_9BACL|nr:hypothetical protein [Paenibacillus taihuensis]REE69726.1 hypothetical protein A8990_13145 [Paenibacillus taihuensis]